MSYTIALIGRPNVGKSTLFNRLVGKRLALVDDQPGVTRDLREGDARLGSLRFRVIDTAGLESATDQSLPGRMRRLTERAVEMADLCLLLIDARAGVSPVDAEIAEILRRSGRPSIVLCNKSEGRAGEAAVLDAYSLGLGDPLAVSAEHGEGIEDLLTALTPRIDAFEAELEAIEAPEGPAEGRPLQLAVVGRPNAGKSTLVNAILGEDRLLTGPEAGITRDSIGLDIDWNGRAFRIFDTAGLRKRARVVDKVEKLSTSDALRAVRFAEVVIVLMDEATAFETQDLRIADLAEREGRAVVFAINKWDAAEDRQARLKQLLEMRDRLLPQLAGAPLVTVSALTGRGLDRLREAVEEMETVWNTRLPTAALNRWLADKLADHPPPAPGGRRIKLRYITQVKARPPSFVISCSRPSDLPESYSRYLVNSLRADFGLKGAPIRLSMKKGDNPYAEKAKKRGRNAKLAAKR